MDNDKTEIEVSLGLLESDLFPWIQNYFPEDAIGCFGDIEESIILINDCLDQIDGSYTDETRNYFQQLSDKVLMKYLPKKDTFEPVVVSLYDDNKLYLRFKWNTEADKTAFLLKYS